ncbi:MAG: GAF domain-containing protein [Actinomycetota bacterium]|nr:GAF domain-containing protein [Actinomycetota bacterium]
MERGSERRYDELAALYRVASLSTSQGDPDSVINEVVRVVASTVQCEVVLLFLGAGETDELRLHRASESIPTMRVKSTDAPFLWRVLRDRSAELSNDIVREVDGAPILVDRLRARQVVAAPLSVGENAFGLIVAVNSTRGAFGEADLRLLTIVADRAALTIENARLVSTLQRQVQELEGLQRLSRLLTSSDSLEQVVGESIRIVADLVPCEKMAILLYDEDDDSLVAHEPVIGIDEPEVASLRVSLAEPTLAGTVYRTNTPLMSNHARTDAWVSSRLQQIFDIETLLVVPLAAASGPIGVLEIVNAEKGHFEEDDLRFATILGGRVGAVIEANLARERERSLMRQLREADRTKTDFVSMLAHELRGPMTTIMGFAYALRDQADVFTEEKRTDVLRIIIREIERLSRMVTDLLDVSRMESGTLSYELEPISIQELIHSIVDIHESLRARHFVESDIDEELPKVLADRDRLSQVLINLLTNATRYSPEGTTIRVRACRYDESPDEVLVSVSDEGIGIAESDKDRVFEKFSMLPKPGWTKKGTGLGLFITKGIIDAHGGHLWIDSELGKGTTFNFTIPIARDESSA